MHALWKNGFYLCLLVILALATGSVMAEIYKWVDTEGNVHFSDEKSVRYKAKPVRLKSSINSYDSTSLPKFDPGPKTTEKTVRQGTKLPILQPRQVIMYSTVWCGYCKQAKAYFRKKGIAFAEKDIEKSPRAKQEYQSLGGGGVPLILVGNKTGTHKLSGFSVARFDAAYN